MNLFRKALGKPVTAKAHRERDIRFLGEQDGPIEQQIKARWKPILAAFPGIQRAYLALATYGRSNAFLVALCLQSTTGDDMALVDALTQPFREMFSSGTPLDIMFLKAGQEDEVKRVCRAFYEVH